MRITPRGAASALAAVLGIISAAVLAWSVSRLVAERIGLSSAPPSVVQGLVPRPRGRGAPLPPHTEDPSGGATATSRSVASASGPSAAGRAAGTAGTTGTAGTAGTVGTAGTAGAPAPSGAGRDSGGSDGGGGGRDD